MKIQLLNGSVDREPLGEDKLGMDPVHLETETSGPHKQKHLLVYFQQRGEEENLSRKAEDDPVRVTG